jgi:NitT/TauT family transport system substrate-binding protein
VNADAGLGVRCSRVGVHPTEEEHMRADKWADPYDAGPARGRGATYTLLVLLLALLLATFAAACGGGDDGSADGGTGGQTSGGEAVTLKIGVIPIADVAPLYLGIDQGFFEEENLTVEPELAAGGADIVPAVMSGSNQIGFSNVVSEMLAASEGLPIQIVSQGVLGAESDADAWSKVLVSGDSDIQEPADLAGKKIAVNTLKNIGEVTIRATLEDAGVDISALEFVEIPFPDMLAALDEGQVDAAWEVEPFVTAGEGAGDRAIIAPYEGTAPSLTVATYFATSDYIEENPDVIDRFVRAMQKSLKFAQSNPDEVRRIVGTYTEIPGEALAAMNLPQWGPDLTVDTIETVGALMVQYGFVDEEPDVSAMIREGGS